MKLKITTETSVPALLNQIEAFRQIICDGTFRTRHQVVKIARAHGFCPGTGGNHVWINAKDEFPSDRIAIVTVEGSKEWPDTAPFGVKEALELQSKQLYAWQAVLRPNVWQKVVKIITATNGTVSIAEDVKRGDDISQCVANIRSEAEQDPEGNFMRLESHAYVVIAPGYWGRGKTLLEAAQNCKKQGASATALTSVLLTVGDDTPEISSDGALIYSQGTQLYRVANSIKLSQLLKLLK